MRKAAYCFVKGRVLEAKRPPFAKHLIIKYLPITFFLIRLIGPNKPYKPDKPSAPRRRTKRQRHFELPPFGRVGVGIRCLWGRYLVVMQWVSVGFVTSVNFTYPQCLLSHPAP